MSMFNKCHIHLCDRIWLNVFLHVQSLLIKHKKIFECFSCFWKVFCFCKNVKKFQKQCCPILATQSRVGPVACPSCKPTQRFFMAHSGSMPQSRKILRIFFKIWVFNVSCDSVWRLVYGWKVQSRENSEIFAAHLVTLLRVELPIAKNT